MQELADCEHNLLVNRAARAPSRFARAIKIPKLFACALVLIVVAAYVVSGIRYSRYSPVRSSNYIWAVYHVHSTMSDGFGSPEEIARQARASGVSLVLLTDHGNPNVAASTFREVVDGVTIVGGSEEKLPDGRLTFFGANKASSLPVSTFPPQAINEARASGAFPIVAYAEDSLFGWRYWKPDLSPGGIEVSNFFTCLRDISISGKILLALYYPFSHYYFLKNVCYPPRAFARWDDLLQRGKTWGFVATDAHGGFRWKKIITAKVPSYADAFSLAGIGINRKYAAQPELAIRAGDFFSCIRGAGEPRAVRFLCLQW